jgi:hypothetical protein
MTARLASVLAAATILAAASPAIAQHRYDGPPLPQLEAGTWQGEWDGAWEDEETWSGVFHGTYTGLDGHEVDAEYRGTFIGETRFLSDDGHALYRDEHRGWREERRGDDGRRERRMGRFDREPRFGYSPEDRTAWLDECRSKHDDRYLDDRAAERGAAIGGAIGAIGGGIAGNRIAGRGDRLEGTIIGAGVGLAGVAIGGAIGADADRRARLDGADYCSDYLGHYERGGMGPAYTGYGYPAVMWVRVPIIRERASDCGCEEVIEEEVVTTRPARRVAPRRPAPDKRVRLTK